MRQGRSCIKRLTFAKLNFTPKNLISIASLATVASSSVQKILYEAPHVPTNIVATYLPKYTLRNKIITNLCLFRYRSLCKYVPGKTVRPTTVSRGTATNSGTHQNVAERRLLHRQLIVFIKVVLFFVIRSEGQRLSIKILFISVADNDLQTGGGGGHPDPEIPHCLL